jgi:hypothetical protein
MHASAPGATFTAPREIRWRVDASMKKPAANDVLTSIVLIGTAGLFALRCLLWWRNRRGGA